MRAPVSERSPLRVLLVEDSPTDAELALRALRRLPQPPGPVHAVHAGDWTEAAGHLATGMIELVLLDYNLPGLTGLEILQRLGDRAHPPVIMLTGQEDVGVAVETLRAGAYDYVSKTTDWGPVLAVTIGRVLERVRLERELAESRVQLASYAAELEAKVAARTAVLRSQAAEIEVLYLKAEEAARVKSRILSRLSHELRTPLNAILGYAELLEDETALEAGEFVRRVRGQTDRLREVVESLLALDRLNAGDEGATISRFTLGALANELRADAIVLNLDRGLTVDWKVPAHPCEVETDREKVRTIARHLLSNAFKFTASGRVEVAIARTDAGGIVLRVSDTGIGLPDEAREIVFDDFQQLDGSTTRRYDGLGLGLGIVKRYAALLGGTLRVDSAMGSGTTIAVEIPPHRPDVGAAPPA